MYFYKDGKKILESDFVSGNVSKGYTTPPGLFSLTYKQRDATLKGQGYASPVKFWMPFNGGIGFHDASWRNTFGGTIYKKNGSHGCVNMPYAAAKTLFENVYAGMPVICYNLAGTENAQSSKASGKDDTAVPAQPTTAAQPTQAPSQTQPAETQAPATDCGTGRDHKAPETAAPTGTFRVCYCTADRNHLSGGECHKRSGACVYHRSSCRGDRTRGLMAENVDKSQKPFYNAF